MSHTVYVLGGGQLGQMMQDETDELGIDIKFLCQPTDPCFRYKHKIGDVSKYQDVLEFGFELNKIPNSVLTIEIEDVNADAIKFLQEKLNINCNDLHTSLYRIQDKAKQKNYLFQSNIPNSDFVSYDPFSTKFYQDFINDQNGPVIWKSRYGGRDGFGVQSIYSLDEISDLTIPFLLEKKISICEEVSILVCRDIYGNMITYPPVRMEFGNNSNQVEIVQYPLIKFHNSEVANQLREIALRTAEVFGCVGLLAVEMFIDIDSNVWVNEVAPRLHNSGHLWTQAADVSQAKNHLLAITGQKIIEPAVQTPTCSMTNISGQGSGGQYEFDKPKLKELYDNSNGDFEIDVINYKKSSVRDNRKMGHIVIYYNGPREILHGDDWAVYEKLVSIARQVKAVPI